MTGEWSGLHYEESTDWWLTRYYKNNDITTAKMDTPCSMIGGNKDYIISWFVRWSKGVHLVGLRTLSGGNFLRDLQEKMITRKPTSFYIGKVHMANIFTVTINLWVHKLYSQLQILTLYSFPEVLIKESLVCGWYYTGAYYLLIVVLF